MAAKQNSFKQMYISTMFNKPKLIAGTSPTLTELLNPTQIKKRLCSVSSQLSELFIWEEQCQNKSTLLLAQRPFTEPLIHLFSLDFLLFKFEQVKCWHVVDVASNLAKSSELNPKFKYKKCFHMLQVTTAQMLQCQKLFSYRIT